MINLFKNNKALLTALTLGSIATTASTAQALTLKVEVENLGPDGGVALTPVWVGFHDGSFDSYNGGLPSERGLEQIAEDGNAMTISEDFLDNLTYIDNNGTPDDSSDDVSGIFTTNQVGTRVDGSIGGSPIAPGTSATNMFEVTPDDANRYFSYVSMVLPSNDYYVANGNPLAHSLTTLFTEEESSISFFIGEPETVNDAGTEINDFAFSAGNVFFPGLPDGQPAPGEGNDENGFNANVVAPFASFLNRPADFDTEFANLNFNNENLYPNGIARVTISRVSVPESSTTVGLMAIGGVFLLGTALRRRNHKIN